MPQALQIYLITFSAFHSDPRPVTSLTLRLRQLPLLLLLGNQYPVDFVLLRSAHVLRRTLKLS